MRMQIKISFESLPTAWSHVSLIMRPNRSDSLSFDDVYNNLRVFENDVKGSTASSSSTQNVAFVSENTSSTNDVSTAYSVSNPSGQNSQQGILLDCVSSHSKEITIVGGEDAWNSGVEMDQFTQKYMKIMWMDCNSSGSDTESFAEQRELLIVVVQAHDWKQGLPCWIIKTLIGGLLLLERSNRLHNGKGNKNGKLDFEDGGLGKELRISIFFCVTNVWTKRSTRDIIDAGDLKKKMNLLIDFLSLPLWSFYPSTVKRSTTKRYEVDDYANILIYRQMEYRQISDSDLSIPDQDDLEIPALEDIYQNPTDGIFTNSSYDDEGAVSGFTNLDTVVNVSPIPTFRIDSIHPSTLILGDPQSAVQTRSKVTKSSGAHAFVSYFQKQRRNNHKDFQHCLFACFLSQNEPKKISEALEDESWVDAMQEELLQFKIQKVWILIDLPYGKKAIRTKWVYRNKKDERGVVVRNKARIEAIRIYSAG
ncbi:hypothetical protein Tco_0522803 [Tanacetum coccineum]